MEAWARVIPTLTLTPSSPGPVSVGLSEITAFNKALDAWRDHVETCEDCETP
jgi:hypothetical protein